jgi:glutamine synthetase
MEVRLGDATANPYLAMAALGAAVYLGIQDKAEPPDKLEGYGYDPGRSPVLPMRLGAPRRAGVRPRAHRGPRRTSSRPS